jgi:hypothetical protein
LRQSETEKPTRAGLQCGTISIEVWMEFDARLSNLQWMDLLSIWKLKCSEQHKLELVWVWKEVRIIEKRGL